LYDYLLLAGALHEGAVQVEKLDEIDAGALSTAEGTPATRRMRNTGVDCLQGFKDSLRPGALKAG
jgi:hypothetical protein